MRDKQKQSTIKTHVLLQPIQEFFSKQSASGILLLFCTLLALIWANSPFKAAYFDLWHSLLNLSLGPFHVEESILHWINDALMAVFFFVVGLEIKREILVGELSTPKKALLPVIAAFGGMIVPALFYIFFNRDPSNLKGWGIPMATDIAFAIGILSLLGNKVPLALKVFLTALAIADDIGAVLVIAFFYTAEIVWLDLLLGALFLSILIAGNRFGVRNTFFYALFGIGGLWTAFFLSGVHPTVAGVLAAFTIPARTRLNSSDYLARSQTALKSFLEAGTTHDSVLTNNKQLEAVYQMSETCDLALTPLQKLEDRLHPWVSYLIMPLFALANAGVSLDGNFLDAFRHSVTWGIGTGLLLGKPIGIFLFSFIAVKMGWALLPASVRWQQIFGAGILGGIGFTMSLFIANLAFGESEILPVAKLGILLASTMAGLLGGAFLLFFREKR